ncbi:MAG: hypothetical protein P4L90_13710 [Rhodopila sp.]|nr:hypothetical protein [Rhodopila sp.]
MGTTNDDFIIGLAKGKIGEVMDRMDRERPEMPSQDREAVTVRLGQQAIAEALAARPDLAERFGDMAAEYFLRAIVNEVRSSRSTT